MFLPLADLAELVGTLAVIALGTWALATDRLTLGGLMAFLALLVQCYSPLRTLGNLLPALYSATAGVERMVELLDEELPQDAPGARDLTDVRGAVELVRRTGPLPGRLPRRAARRVVPDRAGRAGRAWSAPAAPASPPSPGCSPGTSRPPTASSASTARTCRDLTARSVREAVTLVPQETALHGRDDRREHRLRPARAPPAPRSRRPPVAPTPTASSGCCRDGYDTRVGQRGRSLSPAASGSGSRWRGRCSATPRCSSSTSRPPGWTPPRRGGCWRRWPGTGPAARSWSPPTTRSRSSTSTG